MKTIEEIQNELSALYDGTDTLDLPDNPYTEIRHKVQYDQYLAARIQDDIDAELLAAGNEIATQTDTYDFPLEVPGGKLIPVEKS